MTLPPEVYPLDTSSEIFEAICMWVFIIQYITLYYNQQQQKRFKHPFTENCLNKNEQYLHREKWV